MLFDADSTELVDLHVLDYSLVSDHFYWWPCVLVKVRKEICEISGVFVHKCFPANAGGLRCGIQNNRWQDNKLDYQTGR